MADRLIMERLVRGRAPGRDFDITAESARVSMKINSDYKDLLKSLNAAAKGTG